jgi:hypothetical protein
VASEAASNPAGDSVTTPSPSVVPVPAAPAFTGRPAIADTVSPVRAPNATFRLSGPAGSGARSARMPMVAFPAASTARAAGSCTVYDAGLGTSAAAAPASRRRPEMTFPRRPGSSRPVQTRASLTLATSIAGSRAYSIAPAAATTGADSDVPLLETCWPLYQGRISFSPGAARSTELTP